MIKNILSWFTRTRDEPINSIKLDLQPSPEDQRDREYALTADEEQPLPPTYLLDRPSKTVKHQGSIGSCASHAVCTAMEGTQKSTGERVTQLSERFHYYEVRQPDYMDTYPRDSGQYLRLGLKLAQKQGVSPEVLCPYKTNKYNQKPGEWAYAFSRFYKIGAYRRCYGNSAIKKAVYEGLYVPFGIKVRDSIFNENEEGDISPDGSPAGGHAMTIYGWDDNHENPDGTTGAFRFENSWGRGWGDGGCGWIGYEQLVRDWIEAWAVETEVRG